MTQSLLQADYILLDVRVAEVRFVDTTCADVSHSFIIKKILAGMGFGV